MALQRAKHGGVPRSMTKGGFFFWEGQTLTAAQLKTPSQLNTRALGPALQRPENRAAHHVTLGCHHPRPPLGATPTTTANALAAAHDRIACHLDLQSLQHPLTQNARPADSRRTSSRGTTDRPLHRQLRIRALVPPFGGHQRRPIRVSRAWVCRPVAV